MQQPERRLNILIASTALYPFVQDDIDMLGPHCTLDVFVGSGIVGVWQHFRRAMRADVSVAWFGTVYTFFMVLGARLRARGSIVLLGGADVANEPALHYGIWRSRLKGALLSWALRHADAILAVDGSMRQVLERSSRRSWPTVGVLHTGYDTTYWTPRFPKPRMVLTVAASNSPERARVKGIDILMQAARNLPGIPFRVVGVDDATAAAIGEAPANMTFLGTLPRTALLEEYRRAHVYCQPSRREGLPNALCEAMLCGCIPVGTEVGGIPTAIGATGAIVRPEDVEGLTAAIAHSIDLPEHYGAEARTRAAMLFPRERRERILLDTINRIARAKALL